MVRTLFSAESVMDPNNNQEALMLLISMLIGSCFVGYFIGAISVFIANGDRVNEAIQGKIEEAEEFCSKNNFAPELTFAIVNHIKYYWDSNNVFSNNEDIFNSLPPFLQREVSQNMALKYTNDMFIFQDLHSYVRGILSLKLKRICVNAGFDVYKYGHYAKEIYLQTTGMAMACFPSKTETNKPVLKKLKRGSVFGEECFLVPKRVSTIKCITFCEFYLMDIDDIKEVLQEYFPTNDTWNKMMKLILMRVKELQSKFHSMEVDLDGYTRRGPSNMNHEISKPIIDQTNTDEFIDGFVEHRSKNKSKTSKLKYCNLCWCLNDDPFGSSNAEKTSKERNKKILDDFHRLHSEQYVKMLQKRMKKDFMRRTNDDTNFKSSRQFTKIMDNVSNIKRKPSKSNKSKRMLSYNSETTSLLNGHSNSNIASQIANDDETLRSVSRKFRNKRKGKNLEINDDDNDSITIQRYSTNNNKSTQVTKQLKQ